MKGYSLGKMWCEGRLPCETARLNDDEMKLYVGSLKQLIVPEKVLSENDFYDFVECLLPDQKKSIMLYALTWDLYKLFVAGQIKNAMEGIRFPSEQRFGRPLCLRNKTTGFSNVSLGMTSIVEKDVQHQMHSLSLGDNGFSWDVSPTQGDGIYYKTHLVMAKVFQDMIILAGDIATANEQAFPHKEFREFWCGEVEHILKSNSPILEGAAAIDRLHRLVCLGTEFSENLGEEFTLEEQHLYHRCVTMLDEMKEGLDECDMNVSRSMLRNCSNQYWYDVLRDHNGNFMTPEKFWKSVNPRQIAITVKVSLQQHRPPRPRHLLLSHTLFPSSLSLPPSLPPPRLSLFQLALMMRAGLLDLTNSVPEVTEAIMSEEIFPLSQAVQVITEQKIALASLENKSMSANTAFYVMIGIWVTERHSCLSAQRGAPPTKSKITGGARSLKLPPRHRESSEEVDEDHSVLANANGSDNDDGKSPGFQLHLLTFTSCKVCHLLRANGDLMPHQHPPKSEVVENNFLSYDVL